MQARQFGAVLFATVLAAAMAAPSAQAQTRRGDWRAQQDSSGRQMRFRNMDTDGDGVITRAEWRGSLQAFQQEDTNNDNVLSGAEIWGDGGQGSGQDLNQIFDRADRNNDRVLSRDEWYGDLQTFERLDRNDDGRVSLSEFVGDQVEGTSGTRESFNTLDRNNNGVLTVSEWNGDRAEFDELDTDNDGVISRAEYRQGQNRTPAWRAGYQRGLAEGRQAGREDKTINGGRWDLEGQRELEQADSGYSSSVGPREEYQDGYRAGFRRGYALGFGPR